MNRWSSKPLKEFCVGIEDRCGERDLPVFSVSKNLGILPQAERFKKRIASADTSRYKVVRPGDFAFDPMLLWSGSISRHTSKTIGIVSPAYCVFRLINGLNSRFLHLYLTHPGRLPFYDSISFGTNERRRKAQFSDFAELEIPVPPITEQERIVKLLDEADELRKLRAQADWRTADLIPALFHEMFGDVDFNNKKWPMVRFAEIGEARLGKMLDAKQQTGKHKRLYLRNANVQWNRLDLGDLLEMDFSTADREELRLRPGDLLICEGGEVGRAAIWRDELPECYFQKALHRVRPDPSKAIPEFVLHLMQAIATANGFRGYVGSATIPHLTGVKLASIRIPLPPLPLQKEFAARVSEIRVVGTKQATSRSRLDDLFHSLLHCAFRGEL